MIFEKEIKTDENGKEFVNYKLNKDTPGAKDLLNNINIVEKDGIKQLDIMVTLKSRELEINLYNYERDKHDNSKVVALLNGSEGYEITTIDRLNKVKNYEKYNDIAKKQINNKGIER